MEDTRERRCYFFSRGLCKNGEECQFLHSIAEEEQRKLKKKKHRSVIKLPIQLLEKKKSLGYLHFAQTIEIYRKAKRLEELWMDMSQIMSESDKETLHGQSLSAVAGWIFASNKIDHYNTDTVDETFMLLSLPPPVNALLKPSFIAVQNTNKLLQMLLTNKPDVTSHLWCNDETLQVWHLILQTNISLGAGVHRTIHSSVEESLKLLRFILLKIGLVVDCPSIRSFREKIRVVFSMAAFASFYFANTRPYLDGNESLSRIIAVNILDSVSPLPFPLLSPTNTREKYKSVMMEKDPSALIHYMLDCAIFHAEQFVFY